MKCPDSTSALDRVSASDWSRPERPEDHAFDPERFVGCPSRLNSPAHDSLTDLSDHHRPGLGRRGRFDSDQFARRDVDRGVCVVDAHEEVRPRFEGVHDESVDSTNGPLVVLQRLVAPQRCGCVEDFRVAHLRQPKASRRLELAFEKAAAYQPVNCCLDPLHGGVTQALGDLFPCGQVRVDQQELPNEVQDPLVFPRGRPHWFLVHLVLTFPFAGHLSCYNSSTHVSWPCDAPRGSHPSHHRCRRPSTVKNLAATKPPTLYIPGSQDSHPLNPRRPRRLPTWFHRAFERALSCLSRRVRAAGRTPMVAICLRSSNLVRCRDAMMGLQGCLVSPGCTPTTAWLAARPSFGHRGVRPLGFGRLPGFPLPSLRFALRSPSFATSDARTRAATAIGCVLVVVRERLSRHGRVARPP